MNERIFKAYDIRGTYPDMLDEDAAWKVGYATALYFQRMRQFSAKAKLSDTLCVGRDMRPHSPGLAAAVIEGIRATGSNAIDLGMIDTPFIYFAINQIDCIGGIQVTASHSPINYNGFKISGTRAKPIGSATGLDDIKRITGTLRVGKTGLQGKVEQLDLWSAYRKHVLQFLNLARKMRVVVDASNGMAGWMIPAVFDNIPDLEIIPLLFETSGAFTHEPNPLVEANLEMLREKVRQTQPDVGVCFDGDADRCAFIDEQANAIGSDLMTALLARDFLLQPEGKGSPIVYDLRSSRVVAEEITKAGGQPHRDRCGHTFIKKTMADTNAIFGGELSGHYYFRDNFHADSGAIAFAKVVSLLSRQTTPFSELVKPLHRYARSGELSFQTDEKDVRIRDLADKYRKAKVDYLDGITVDFGDWWFNVRKSNTEPLLRLNMECPNEQMLQDKLQELRALLGPEVKSL
jgi:phosphomannomutase